MRIFAVSALLAVCGVLKGLSAIGQEEEPNPAQPPLMFQVTLLNGDIVTPERLEWNPDWTRDILDKLRRSAPSVMLKTTKNGEIAWIGHNSGVLDGFVAIVRSNRKPRFIGTYQNGQPQGVLCTWNPKGEPLLSERCGDMPGTSTPMPSLHISDEKVICYFQDAKPLLIIEESHKRNRVWHLIKSDSASTEEFSDESQLLRDPQGKIAWQECQQAMQAVDQDERYCASQLELKARVAAHANQARQNANLRNAQGLQKAIENSSHPRK